MKRYLCCLALLGILVIPDWAEACWPMWNRPMPANPLYSYPPVYPPIYVYPTVFPPPGYSIPPANAEISPKITSPKPLPPPVVVPSKTTSSDVPPSPTGGGGTSSAVRRPSGGQHCRQRNRQVSAAPRSRQIGLGQSRGWRRGRGLRSSKLRAADRPLLLLGAECVPVIGRL